MKNLLTCCLFVVFVATCSAVFAADKVVVVPFGSSAAKGADGSVQYNDGGKTAGAEVYYDKITGKLEVLGEVRAVDGSGNNRLWSQGRPGVTLLTHSDPNGYCTSDGGTKFALSTSMSEWGNAASVCPQGTWVCSVSDLPTSGSCLHTAFSTITNVNCAGAESSVLAYDYLPGWVSDVHTTLYSGKVRRTDDLSMAISGTSCSSYRVWCCWD